MSPLRLDTRMQPPLLGPFLGLGQAVPAHLAVYACDIDCFIIRVNRCAGELRSRSQGCSIRVRTHSHRIRMADKC
jgi:hypothetical protein